MIDFQAATRFILHVGQEKANGQGFVVEIADELGEERVIVIAAYCLTRLPSAHRASFSEERTYKNLLAF